MSSCHLNPGTRPSIDLAPLPELVLVYAVASELYGFAPFAAPLAVPYLLLCL